MELTSEILSLIRKTSTEIPNDIRDALKNAKEKETNSISKNILSNILENIELAKKESTPICQDTGVPIFYVKSHNSYSQIELRRIINEAINIATTGISLRPNAVDCLNQANNTF